MMSGLGGGRGTFWGEMGLVRFAAADDGSSFRSFSLRLRLSWC